MRMMIKVQVVIQSLAQKAVCVSSVHPFIINFIDKFIFVGGSYYNDNY